VHSPSQPSGPHTKLGQLGEHELEELGPAELLELGMLGHGPSIVPATLPPSPVHSDEAFSLFSSEQS